MKSEVLGRFMDKVSPEPNTGCWLWTGTFSGGKGDYGYFKALGETRAHRVAYRLFVGDIPKGLVIDHICRVTFCVNPKHLRVVTRFENTLCGTNFIADNVRKTHCIRGHSLKSARRRLSKSANPARACGLCERQSRIEKAARERAELVADRDRLREMLRKLEWSGSDEEDGTICPVCRAQRYSEANWNEAKQEYDAVHSPDCALKGMLEGK